MWIPFFGWYIAKMRMIPVDRGSRSKALKAVVAATKAEMARNDRQLIIYPEGTRRAPGDEPAYKYGIVELYAQLGMPVVPVAHVAGLYWPRRKFMRYPGTIKARFLKPIAAGLDSEEFMARLIARDRGGLRRAAGRGGALRKPAAAAADGDQAAQGARRRDLTPHLRRAGLIQLGDVRSAELQAKRRGSGCRPASASWRWRSAR